MSLTLPLKLNDGKVLGVLRLVNSATGAFAAEMLPVARCSPPQPQRRSVTPSLPMPCARRLDTVMRLGMCAEYRDKETSAHIHRMAHISRLLARELKLSEGFATTCCSPPMHDVGKIGIPDAILQSRDRSRTLNGR